MNFIRKYINRIKNIQTLYSVDPKSRLFGFDRGKPIDRLYIEHFISANSSHIKGRVLEIAEDTYSKKFGKEMIQSDIFGFTDEQKNATVIGDLTKLETLEENRFDCFICTQTLNFIYDFHTAVEGIKKILKPNGVALVTVAGICQVSRYDADRWGDFWRFNQQGIEKSFADVFGKECVETFVYGNSYAATMFLNGFASEECNTQKLMAPDIDYPVVIGVRIVKEK